jgi:hypothetical protein
MTMAAPSLIRVGQKGSLFQSQQNLLDVMAEAQAALTDASPNATSSPPGVSGRASVFTGSRAVIAHFHISLLFP